MTELSAVRQQCEICGPNLAWCKHLTEHIQNWRDVDELDYGIVIQVPIRLKGLLFADVSIGLEKPEMPGMAEMKITVLNPFDLKQQDFYIGLWSPGEGMWSIRSVVLDWIKSRISTGDLTKPSDCPSTGHKPFIHKGGDGDPVYHNWCIAAFGMCQDEYELMSAIGAKMLVPDANDKDNSTLQHVRARHGRP